MSMNVQSILHKLLPRIEDFVGNASEKQSSFPDELISILRGSITRRFIF